MDGNVSIPSRDTLLTEFNESGFVILRDFVAVGVRDEVRAELSGIVDEAASQAFEAGKITSLFEDEPFETRLVRLFEGRLDEAPKSWRTNLHRPGLFPLFFCPPLLDAVELILGSEVRLYPNYTARPKFPEWKGTEVLWHQDGGYTAPGSDEAAVKTMHMVNVWTPLVPATVENGCMQFVPGTHTLGVVPHVKKEHYLEIDPQHLDPRRSDAIPIELDPGDIVLFHNLLFHCGLPNKAKTIRWSLDWRYQNALESTQRRENGHIARSTANPDAVVKSREAWSQLTFS